ncbi:General transcription factor 3C polypeptide 3 [Quillaja saponaria]|uniref:General transcription factor 3C polypeptide 3 n=1 Tax=Quillaja saponaria TaxID=32244 RepID=A0AAD7PN49_QUISA|nr:General transcription factor 3C polypeptide 3 [Quillaja saponaria]
MKKVRNEVGNVEVASGNSIAEGSGGDVDVVDKVVVEQGEEQEEEDADEIEGVDEDDGDYTFRFKDGINPLDFVEDNASGVQSYQQFERLEYEALAHKKRKALADCPSEVSMKKARQEDISGASMDEIMEAMSYGLRRRKSRKPKKRGRQKGSKNKLSPEITKMLGDATLHYAHGRYEEAIAVLHEVVRIAPNLPDSYHTLGLVHKSLGDNRKAMDFYMIAAHLTPKDSSFWKLLFSWSIEQKDIGQANYCLSKALTSDPKDITLRLHRASLYVELGDYHKAAEAYEQIYLLCPENIDALKAAAEFYRKCGQLESSCHILEDYLKGQPTEADLSVIDLLAAILMDTNAYDKALEHIEHAQLRNSSNELPWSLKIRAGICHIHLRNLQMAQVLYNDLQKENALDHLDLIIDIADSLMSLEHYDFALKYYLMLEGTNGGENGVLHLKVARCYLFLKERLQAISFYYRALETLNDDVDARITLASLLLEESKEDEAIALLSPPKDLDSTGAPPDKCKQWWANEKVKLKLCNIYRNKGMLEEFVGVIFPLVRESLYVATLRQKRKVKKRLSRRDLEERIKVLDDRESDNVFRGFRPLAPHSDLSKAARAKRLLQKKTMLKEKKKAQALASGIDWQSDDSDDKPQKIYKEPPLHNLLKDEEHHQLILQLCKALASLQRYWEALEIVNLILRLGHNTLSDDRKEELRSLGAQMAFNTTDPKHGFDCVKYIVLQHPYSFAAWNCYYKVMSRLENRDTRHYKFVRMQGKLIDCVPPILISGHQFTMLSHHQDAARKYLEAYKLLPENPLINLCVGTALINLALGFRLQNKHQCIVQGLAFLYNNLRICENSQESLYNLARAFQHVGLVTLAASYYEKVLATHENDYPIPKLPNENLDVVENRKSGYCDLRREAAYNLHLIYKKSGAIDLARQVLKDHCTF